MSRTAFAALAVLAFTASLMPVAAHDPPLPPLPTQAACTSAEPLHHYAAATSLEGAVSWRTTVALFDSCPLDGEADFGVGGGFLPASHHGSYDGNTGKWTITVCVDDYVWGSSVGLIVGIDSGGGNVQELAQGVGCATATSFTTGASSGWYVFLTNRVVGTTVIAPTIGHIYDI